LVVNLDQNDLIMASITIKSIEDSLLSELKEMAKKNRRSLNKEIIFQLEQLVIESKPLSYEEMIEVRNKYLPKMRGRLTEEQIEEGIAEGRE